VHTDVDVHRENNNTASVVGAAQVPTSPTRNKHRNQGAWLESTLASKGGDDDDEFYGKEKSATFYNAV
jgi:hypothetical protein